MWQTLVTSVKKSSRTVLLLLTIDDMAKLLFVCLGDNYFKQLPPH